MNTVEQFIDALGGTVAVANAMDLAPTTVSSWKSSNSIPKWRLDGLRTLASEKSVDVPDSIARRVAPPADEQAAA
jgi:hypothetical protein